MLYLSMAADHEPGCSGAAEERKGRQEGGEGWEAKGGLARALASPPSSGSLAPPHGHPLVSEPGRVKPSGPTGRTSLPAIPEPSGVAGGPSACRRPTPPSSLPPQHRPHQPAPPQPLLDPSPASASRPSALTKGLLAEYQPLHFCAASLPSHFARPGKRQT